MNTPITIVRQTCRCVVGHCWRGDIADAAKPYDGFNVCHYTGDAAEHIATCRAALGRHFDVKVENIIIPRQVHGTKIAVIQDNDFDHRMLESVDAVICIVPGLIIGVNTADCIPVILCDEEAGIIAAVHAGWRGAVAGIVEKCVDMMNKLGAKQISAYIGAGICRDCFEVGEEVAERFPDSFVIRRHGEKPHIDLPAFVADCLRSSGITDITKTVDCTRHLPNRYFSARALGIASGRNFTFTLLRKPT